MSNHTEQNTTAPSVRRVGIECSRCGCGHFEVVYTRAASGGRIIRRRECRHCGRRVTTQECVISTKCT